MASPYNSKMVGGNVEDCRDFLRTGRCKYGASCKFNHPPNVQTGGGMKAPSDPSEPLFPIRPNEPVCQYYMKHGTCKFGQACKFHHPPQSSLSAASLVGGSNLFLPNGSDAAALPQHVLLNTTGSQEGSSTMVLQFLPQRPDEPDCLYFLRNGSCKYGATCRYHHPVNHQQRKQGEVQRRQQQVVQMSDGSVQYVQNQQTFSPQNSRLVSTAGGQHVLVTETPIQVMSVNGGGYQGESSHSDYGQSGSAMGTGMMGLNQDHASSSSSIASSYEASSSNLDYINQNPGVWNRPPKRSTSGSSLKAFGEAHQARQQTHVPNRVVSENSMNSRRLRTASFGSMGSASEQSGYQDGIMGWGGSTGNNQLPVHQERYVDSDYDFEQPGLQYMVRVDSAYEGRRNNGREDPYRQSHEQVRHVSRQGPPPGMRRNQSGDYVDHGLSMMTSALLNMLDTPEEAVLKNNASRISSSSTLNNNSSPSMASTTPRSGNVYSPQSQLPVLNDTMMPRSASHNNMYSDPGHQVVYKHTEDHVSPGPPGYTSRNMYDGYTNSSVNFQDSDPRSVSSHYPIWHETAQSGRLHAQSKSPFLQHHPSNGPPSPESNVGLYLS